MNTVSEYIVRLRADISGFKAEMGQAREEIKQVRTQSEKLSETGNKIKTALKGVGAAVVAAFSVRAIINFGSAAVNLGSKLNAMNAMSNKAFGSMSDDVKKWANSASTSFGLSRRMALQYTSTLGSMAQGFGITGQQAVDMSETIAGRIGDLASYFSISQDEAYNKMTAIFTGETESLKSLGIVMSQTALDAYAMANGFGKTTNQMTDQEKVLLRYQFLLDKTKLAEGDFVDSSARSSWGNQIRQLKLQLEDFKASIGQGLIVVLTPVLKLLNQLLAKIVTVSNAFADMMAKISGAGKKSVTSVVPAMQGVGEVSADAAETTADAAQDLAKKAKEAERTILSFDQLHTLQKQDEESGVESPTATSPATSGDQIKTQMQNAAAATSKTSKVFDDLIKRAKELVGIFKNGFKDGFGDASFDPLLENIDRIKNALTNIFTNPEVLNGANTYVERLTFAFGQVTGSMASIGITIATALTGGIGQYLEENSDRISSFITDMFDISGDLAELRGNLSVALADIFSVFADENGVTAISNFIGIFTDAFMGITELLAKFSVDIETLFAQPIIDNADKIKQALDGILEFFGNIFGSIKEVVDNAVDTANAVYDEHIGPLFDSLTKGVSDIVGSVLDVWNKDFKPVLDEIGQQFDTLCDEHLTPLINTALELIGQIADTLRAFWENILKPFIQWFVENILPVIAPIIKLLSSQFFKTVGEVIDRVNNLLTILKDLLQFIEDVFKGDWDAAWNDIGVLFEDVWNGVKEHITGTMNAILGVIEFVVNGVIEGINMMVRALNNLSFDVPDWVPWMGGNSFGFNLSELAPVTLPRLKYGGFAETGDIFMANEDGPELMGTFGNKTAVANNVQIVAGITDGVQDAIAPFMLEILSAIKSKKDGGAEIVIDGERLARIVTRNQERIRNREYAF